MLVEVAWGDGGAGRARRVDDRDPRFGEVALDRTSAGGSRAFEARLVVGFGVCDIELPGDRVRDHVEEHRTDARVVGGFAQRRDIDGEHVLVGKGIADTVVPVAPEFVLELARGGVPLHDQADLGCFDTGVVVVGAGDPPR